VDSKIDPRPQLRRRIPQIELIRVMATVAIFVFHLWSLVPISSSHALAVSLLSRIPLLGAVGVILFNFIAGFVLAAPRITEQGLLPGPGYGAFLDRRFGRICRHYYPALLLWTALTVAVPCEGRDPTGTVLKGLLSHLLMVHTLDSDTFFSIVPAFWWMGLLAQFYLAFPLLWELYRRLGSSLGCALICILSWTGWGIMVLFAGNQTEGSIAWITYMGYFNLPFRLPEFGIGMWLASTLYRCEIAGYRVRSGCFILPPYSSQALAAALFGSLFALSSDSILGRLGRPFDHLYVVVWCLVLFYAVFSWATSETLGSSPILAKTASASFSIYLLHQPLLGYAERLLGPHFQANSRFFVLLVVVAPFCYVAAGLFDRLVQHLTPKG
jgi:peptidoglycan/LPS O-acetylase OafA/YrhL